MFDFRDVSAENQINGFSTYFDAINYPAQPLSAESKAFFNGFFGGEGFVTLCDLLFGPYHDKHFTDGEELCWMDLANIAPTGGVATALSKLIHPNSAFVSTLEALSIPSASFAVRLKRGWKNAAEAQLTSFLYTDLPLSALYPQSYQLMGEPADANLYALPRSRVPPVILVPFWEPPVVTRKELSQQQILTSLPCSPMGYFIFRLLFCGMTRVQQNSSEFLANRRYVNLVTWLWRAKDSVSASLYKKAPVDMPYYTQMLQSFIQIYISPSVPRHLGSKPSICDVTWTASDVAAALLIMAPTLLAHRQLLQPMNESARFGITNTETLAQIVSLVPLHTSMMYGMLQSSSDVQFPDAKAGIPADFASSAASKAQSDLEYIGGTLYRNCLVILRECLLSLELEPYCKAKHFTYCLELWAVLMSPFDRQQRPLTPQYVVHHFEAFGFIAIDILNMLVKSSFVYTVSEDSARVLKKCFLFLTQEPVTNLLAEINASQMSLGSTVEVLSRHFVLNWVGNDGNIQLPNLHGDTTCNLAARAYVLIERALTGEASEATKNDLRETLSLMTQAFPRATAFLDTWRTAERSTYKRSESHQSASPPAAKQLTDGERSSFLKGGKRQPKTFFGKLRLPTRNGRIPGGQHPALKTSLRTEMPLLLGLSQFFDAIIVKALEMYYSSLIPKCDRGHSLWLLYSTNYSCCNHPHEAAIWECAMCETVYGSCCKGAPCRSDGERLAACGNPNTSMQQPCSVCGQVVPDDSGMFSLQRDTKALLCPDCASRPFSAPSTRWIAAYSTWAVIVVVLVLYSAVLLLST